METYLLLLIIKVAIFAHTFIIIMGIIVMIINPNNHFISNIISKYKPYISIDKNEYESDRERHDYGNYIPLLSAKY